MGRWPESGGFCMDKKPNPFANAIDLFMKADFYNSENSIPFFFRFLNITILIIHIIIMIFSFYADATLLGVFNIGSMLLYTICFIIISAKNYSLYFYITASEVILHSYIVSLVFSESMGFYLYLVLIVPVSYLCLYLSGTNHVVLKGTISSVVAFIVYNILYHITGYDRGMYKEIDETTTKLIHSFNSSLLFIILILVCVIIFNILTNYVGQLSSENVLLSDEANHDPLTGLNNRRLLDMEMDKKISLYNRNNTSFSILMCDIDDFKKVNDTYGHDEGDIVLKDIAKLLHDCTRPGDFLCRWGGEEFLVILMNANSKEASLVAHRIRGAVEGHSFHLSMTNINCTITIGIASIQKNMSKEDMYNLADERLYKGKQTGKNKVVYE